MRGGRRGLIRHHHANKTIHKQVSAETSGTYKNISTRVCAGSFGTYKNISVDVAYEMIKKAQVSLILDARNQSEYELGHLYGAVLIPIYKLEGRISELQEYMDDPIIVYCKAGSSILNCIPYY